MAINHSNKPDIPQMRNPLTAKIQKKFCVLQNNLKSEILKDKDFLDKKIFQIIGLDNSEKIDNSLKINLRSNLVQELHRIGIKLFDSVKNYKEFSNYTGKHDENIKLYSFLNKFGDEILDKKNYQKLLLQKSFKSSEKKSLLNDSLNLWSTYEEAEKWVSKYNKCEK